MGEIKKGTNYTVAKENADQIDEEKNLTELAAAQGSGAFALNEIEIKND